MKKIILLISFIILNSSNLTNAQNNFGDNFNNSYDYGYESSVYNNEYYGDNSDSLITSIKTFINRILGILALLGFPLLVVGIVFLSSYQKDENAFNQNKYKIKTKNIYTDYFNIKTLGKQEANKLKEHGFNKRFSPGLAIFLNIITFGFFGLIYYGLANDNLLNLKDDDFGSGKAIGFMFIPLFNIYRSFIFWLRLADRLNFQLKLRNINNGISKNLIITYLILRLIPYLNLVAMLILSSILIYQIQKTINYLAEENVK